MGYDLYITRATNWSENGGREITREEWLRLVEQDPELSIDPVNGPLFAMWKPQGRDTSAWLDWFEGNVYTKNPGKHTLGKMLEIASILDAAVQGDDGENYSHVEDLPDSREANPGSQTGTPLLKRERLWNRWEYIAVALVVLAYVLYDVLSD